LKHSTAMSRGTPFPHIKAAIFLILEGHGSWMNMLYMTYEGQLSTFPKISSTACNGSMTTVFACHYLSTDRGYAVTCRINRSSTDIAWRIGLVMFRFRITPALQLTTQQPYQNYRHDLFSFSCKLQIVKYYDRLTMWDEVWLEICYIS